MRTFSRCLCLGALLLLLGGCGAKGGQLTVVFPKIGSADTAVLMTQEATVVIDTGETGDADELLSLLEDYHRDTVDLLILSHYDKDHVGGAAQLLENMPVRRVIGSTSPKVSDEMSAYRAALTGAGLQEEVPAQSMTLSLGGMSLTIDPPGRTRYDSDQSNNSSLIVTVEYGQTRLLFLGDAMSERLSEVQWDSGSFDLVKVPHHGRDRDTLSAYLPAMAPGAAAVITSSKKEPEDEALTDALSEAGMTPYLTRRGAVTAVSDGSALTVRQEE